jgi:hypothetical protein
LLNSIKRILLVIVTLPFFVSCTSVVDNHKSTKQLVNDAYKLKLNYSSSTTSDALNNSSYNQHVVVKGIKFVVEKEYYSASGGKCKYLDHKKSMQMLVCKKLNENKWYFSEKINSLQNQVNDK